MKKFQFMSLYEEWNQRTLGKNITNIKIPNEFELMINNGIETIDWVIELLEKQHTWILIIILNGLYDKNSIIPPQIPTEFKSNLNQVTKVHLEHLKNKLKELHDG